MKWKRIEPTVVTKIDYRQVVVKTFETPDGNTTTRAIFHLEDMRAAGVVALTKDHQVIVAKQYRPGPEKVLQELPGGGVEEGEEPEAAARRELLEETGYVPGSMTFLGEFHHDAYMHGSWYYYFATDCELQSDQMLDHEEFVEVELISIETFINNAKQGKMTDVAAVLAAYDELMKLQKGDSDK